MYTPSCIIVVPIVNISNYSHFCFSNKQPGMEKLRDLRKMDIMNIHFESNTEGYNNNNSHYSVNISSTYSNYINNNILR